MNNDDKIREILESEEIPDEISPENIRNMLDEKAPKKKRSGISVAGRITAIASACALIVGVTAGSVHLMNSKDKVITGDYTGDYSVDENNSGNNNASNVPYEVYTDENGKSYAVYSPDNDVNVKQADAPYMNSAESYEQIYQLIADANENESSSYRDLYFNKGIYTETAEIASDGEALYYNGVTNDEYNLTQSTSGTGGYGLGSGEQNEITEPIIYPVETEPAEPTTEEPAEPTTEEPAEPTTEESAEPTTEEPIESDDEEYSDTYNQEENVLEADIVKTDGKKIYYLTNIFDENYNSVPVINIASVDKGNFTDSTRIDVMPETYLDDSWDSYIYISDMYLYNDMIAVIGNVNSSCQIYDYDEEYYDDHTLYTPYCYEWDNRCFVSFYTKDAELIGTYWQDGSYNDVRISPDGYMYLVTNYTAMSFDEIGSAENIEKYIPECAVDDNRECIPPENILLPEDTLDNSTCMSYTIIGSIDLTVSAQFTPADTKALAGYTGSLYTSADNIYTTVGWENTEITRISVSGGNIVPVATGKIEGYVKDQFSLSEYNGYLRVASTVDIWNDNSNFITDILNIPADYEHIQDNRVYVLDMDMNIVGSVEGFGKDETIKSVNFSGNMGYVVTYEQTDPLFAIDLSNPTDPFITDEFKILGYSTYMQNWTDGLLLGFGADADAGGMQDGIKLVMFDNSDPYNLQEVGLYAIHNTESTYVHSPALWERKQLLIAPEKNIIGIPVVSWNSDTSEDKSEYVFFEYTDGEFIRKGEISKTISYDYTMYDSLYNAGYYDRALYIGDYVYVVSIGKFISVDIDTISVVDEVDF